jgi:hypothetical protein
MEHLRLCRLSIAGTQSEERWSGLSLFGPTAGLGDEATFLHTLRGIRQVHTSLLSEIPRSQP